MRRAALIFNPNAGRGGLSRLAALQGALRILADRAIEAEIISTVGPGTAGTQAADAVDRGADLVFACGGDGTVHEVIQAIACRPSVTVGVVPLGSANALGRHLGLSLNTAEAVRQQLGFVAREIPLGRITYETADGACSRYFAVMAGAGPDGALVYQMLASSKQRIGRSSYYMRAARLFLGSRFSSFRLSATCADGSTAEQEAVSAMAIRVGDLGGMFRPLAVGAAPDDESLQLVATEPPAHLGLPAWFGMSWAGLHRWNPYSRQLQVQAFECSAGLEQPVRVQADGEFLGYTPMRVELVPNALRLLMPTSQTER